MTGIILERHGARADIVLSQPRRKNAMSQAMWHQLGEQLEKLSRDATVRVVVMRGAGDVFCSGADISEFERIYASPAAGIESNRYIASALAAMDQLPIPSIAMIRGACMGGGCALAEACDLQVADRTARFGINPTSLGLSYSPRDCQRLVARVGIGRAKSLLIGARIIDAGTALSWGLVSEVVAVEALEETVDARAREIASRSPQALGTLKTIINTLDHGQTVDTHELQNLFEACFESSDFREGANAFREKRKPSFEERRIP